MRCIEAMEKRESRQGDALNEFLGKLEAHVEMIRKNTESRHSTELIASKSLNLLEMSILDSEAQSLDALVNRPLEEARLHELLVKQVLAQMKEPQQRIVRLLSVEHYSVSEVAAKLGVEPEEIHQSIRAFRRILQRRKQ